eukprot:Gb_29715 [translate_table: standard]
MAQSEALITHTCLVQKNPCSLIIDLGSMKNLISSTVVAALRLPLSPHPKPYNVGLVLKIAPCHVIDQQCTFTLALDDLVDAVICDVTALDCCNVLLGSPFLYDMDANFYQVANVYVVCEEGVQYLLVSSKQSIP